MKQHIIKIISYTTLLFLIFNIFAPVIHATDNLENISTQEINHIDESSGSGSSDNTDATISESSDNDEITESQDPNNDTDSNSPDSNTGVTDQDDSFSGSTDFDTGAIDQNNTDSDPPDSNSGATNEDDTASGSTDSNSGATNEDDINKIEKRDTTNSNGYIIVTPVKKDTFEYFVNKNFDFNVGFGINGNNRLSENITMRITVPNEKKYFSTSSFEVKKTPNMIGTPVILDDNKKNNLIIEAKFKVTGSFNTKIDVLFKNHTQHGQQGWFYFIPDGYKLPLNIEIIDGDGNLDESGNLDENSKILIKEDNRSFSFKIDKFSLKNKFYNFYHDGSKVHFDIELELKDNSHLGNIEIIDILPEGLEFHEEDQEKIPSGWEKINDTEIKYTKDGKDTRNRLNTRLYLRFKEESREKKLINKVVAKIRIGQDDEKKEEVSEKFTIRKKEPPKQPIEPSPEEKKKLELRTRGITINNLLSSFQKPNKYCFYTYNGYIQEGNLKLINDGLDKNLKIIGFEFDKKKFFDNFSGKIKFTLKNSDGREIPIEVNGYDKYPLTDKYFGEVEDFTMEGYNINKGNFSMCVITEFKDPKKSYDNGKKLYDDDNNIKTYYDNKAKLIITENKDGNSDNPLSSSSSDYYKIIKVDYNKTKGNLTKVNNNIKNIEKLYYDENYYINRGVNFYYTPMLEQEENLKLDKIIELLPPGIKYRKGSMYFTNLQNKYQFNQEPIVKENFQKTGKTALIFYLPNKKINKNYTEEEFEYRYGVKMEPFLKGGLSKIESYVSWKDINIIHNKIDQIPEITNPGDENRSWSVGYKDTKKFLDIDGTDNEFQHMYEYLPEYIYFNSPEEMVSSSWGKGNKDNDYVTYKAMGDLGTKGYEKIKIKNNSSSGKEFLTIIDILPKVGDKQLVSNNEKGSEFSLKLSGPIELDNEDKGKYTVYYTTEEYNFVNPNLTEFANKNIWTTKESDFKGDYKKVTAIKIVLNPGSILEGNKEVEFKLPFTLPSEKENLGKKAINSFATSEVQSLTNFLESNNTEFQINAYKVEGYIFNDKNKNGTYDDKEGIKGRKVELRNTNGTKIAEIETDEKGYYSFILENIGKYKIYTEIKSWDQVIEKGDNNNQKVSHIYINGETDEFEINEIRKNITKNAGFIITKEQTPTPVINIDDNGNYIITPENGGNYPDGSIVTDDKGNEIGKIDGNGNYTPNDPNNNLKPGDIIKVVEDDKIPSNPVTVPEQTPTPVINIDDNGNYIITPENGGNYPDGSIVTDDKGNEIGKIDGDGNYTPNDPNNNLKPGDIIKVVEDNKLPSNPVTVPEQTPTPVINIDDNGNYIITPENGGNYPDGSIVTDDKGNEIGKIDGDGNYTPNDPNNNLKPGDIIKVVEDNKLPSNPVTVPEQTPTPVINIDDNGNYIITPENGGNYPDGSIVTDDKGNEIGKIDGDGNYTPNDPNNNLKPGDIIKVVEDNKLPSNPVTVPEQTPTPVINIDDNGNYIITPENGGNYPDGSIVTDDKGNEIGKIDGDGNYTPNDPNNNLKPGDIIKVVEDNKLPSNPVTVPEQTPTPVINIDDNGNYIITPENGGNYPDGSIVTDDKGNEIGKIDGDGNYTPNDPNNNLKPGDIIKVVEDNKLPSNPVTVPGNNSVGSNTGSSSGGGNNGGKVYNNTSNPVINDKNETKDDKNEATDDKNIDDKTKQDTDKNKGNSKDKSKKQNDKDFEDTIKNNPRYSCYVPTDYYFPDIDDKTFGKYLHSLAYYSIMTGFKDGYIKPKNNITRAEYLKVLFRALCIDYKNTDTSTVPFKDIKENFAKTWEAQVVAKALELGMIDGKKKNFRATDSVTRAEAMKLFMIASGEEVDSSIKTSTYNDVNGWMIPYVEKALELGMIKKGKKFRSNHPITRGENAKTMYNFIVQDKES